MKSIHHFLLLFLILIFTINCKKTEIRPIDEILKEKEKLLIGNWVLNNGLLVIKSDSDSDGIYKYDTIIYNDNLVINPLSYTDTSFYFERLTINSDYSFVFEQKTISRYGNPPNVDTGLFTFHYDGLWYIVGNEETLDFESEFTFLMEIKNSFLFTPIDTGSAIINYFKEKKIIYITDEYFFTFNKYTNYYPIGEYTEKFTYKKK